MKKILIVDDSIEFSNLLGDILSEFYSVDVSNNPSDAFVLYKDNDYDLIILDLYMDVMKGTTFMELAFKLLDNPNIVFISGTESLEDQMELLDSPALEFIPKSTPPEIILKRIQQIMDRISQESTNQLSISSKREDVEVNFVTREVKVKGEVIHLTNKEYDLLCLLLENKGEILSREDIYLQLWGEIENEEKIRIVDLNIFKLRKKLNVKSLYSERGEGYVWNE